MHPFRPKSYVYTQSATLVGMMSERITITIDENTRTRLNAHPEITPTGLFEKATMELDMPKAPEEIIAWKAIEIARIGLEKTKLTIQHETALRHQEMQQESFAVQHQLMEKQRELNIKQDEIDANTTARKMDLTRAKFEVARAKDIITTLQRTDIEDGNIYLDTLDELSEILAGTNLTVLDTKKISARGKEIFVTLSDVLARALRKHSTNPTDPLNFTGPSDLFKGFEETAKNSSEEE